MTGRRWRQDDWKLRRYKKRWKVKRTLAWLQNFRRLRQDCILIIHCGFFISLAYKSLSVFMKPLVVP
jgi:transposase